MKKITVFAAVLILTIISGAGIIDSFSFPYAGWSRSGEKSFLIKNLEPSGPAAKAGFMENDKIVEVNGEPVDNFKNIIEIGRNFQVGDTVVYKVKRQDDILEIPLTFQSLPAHAVLERSINNIVGLLFLAVGVFVFLNPPEKKLGILFFLLCTGFCFFKTAPPRFSSTVLSEAYRAVYLFIFYTLPVLFFHFFLLFPRKVNWLRRFPRFQFWIYLPSLFLFSSAQIMNLIILRKGKNALLFEMNLMILGFLLWFVFFLGGVISFLQNFKTKLSRIEIRALSWIFWSMAVAFVPYFIIAVGDVAFHAQIPHYGLADLPTVFIPFGFMKSLYAFQKIKNAEDDAVIKI